jgi:hypothetical protein
MNKVVIVGVVIGVLLAGKTKKVLLVAKEVQVTLANSQDGILSMEVRTIGFRYIS